MRCRPDVMAASAVALIPVLWIASCSPRSDEAAGDTVELAGLTTATLPLGWQHELRAGTVVARPRDGSGVRVDLTAVSRRDGGFDRTPTTAASAVRRQVELTSKPTFRRDELVKIGGLTAAVSEWDYEHEGQKLSRRHWVVEVADALVHVSCVGPREAPPADCDAIAASLTPASRAGRQGVR